MSMMSVPQAFHAQYLYQCHMEARTKHVTPETANPPQRFHDLLATDDIEAETRPSREEQARVDALVEAAVSYRSSSLQRGLGLLSDQEFAWMQCRFLRAVEAFQRDTEDETHQERGDIHIVPKGNTGLIIL